MEGNLEQSPKLGLPIDTDDVKYISGLSTILVATIQEAKERISQIEYIFCSQLYPNFQLKSKGLQKIYTEANKAAEDAWKKKENEFTLQLRKLELEKKQVLEENQSFMLEKEKLLNEQEEKMRQLRIKLQSQELKIEELEEELRLKSKEFDQGKKFQDQLLQLVQTNASVICNKDDELKEHEEKANALRSDLNYLQKKVEALRRELREKTQEVDDGKKLAENLLKKIESQALDIMHNEEQHEVEEGRKLQEQLLIQIDLKDSEILKYKQQFEENQSFMLEKEELLNEQEEKMRQLRIKLQSQELKIEELEEELRLKSKEVDQRIIFQDKLLQLVQTNASVICNKDDELKEHEEKANVLRSDLNYLQKKVEALRQELREKTQEVDDGKKLAENLLKKIELQALDIMHNEEQLISCNKEKKLLMANFEKLKETYEELHVELRKKKHEVEEGRKLQEQLLIQIDLKDSETLKYKQQFEEYEKVKGLLLTKVKGLEQKVNELQVKLREYSDDAVEGRDSYENLLKQIELKASELTAEKKKKRDLLDAYKRLKSQYNFLCRKNGLTTTENMTLSNNLEDESDLARHHQNPKPSLDTENKISNTPTVVSDTKTLKDVIGLNGNLEDEKGAKPVETSSSHLPASSFPTPKCPSSVKSNPIAGRKRPVSGWRDTRSRQGPAGPDPHDDFLDTPLENIKGNLEKAMKKEADDPPTVPEDMNIDTSDDETQDVPVGNREQKQEIPFQMADKGTFKYVEPVRKKAEREKLRGFECNQCKKFYDAVLNKGDQDDEDCNKNFRCEHHDGVSRHRYKYAPPMTPEGFWNIGFESEM